MWPGLARRFRFQFGTRTFLALPAIIAAILALDSIKLAQCVVTRNRPLNLFVLDAATYQPVPAATLTLSAFGEHEEWAESQSGRDGFAKLTAGFPTVVQPRLFRESGYVDFSASFLDVSAPGYDAKFFSLAELTGVRRSLDNPLPITIYLLLDQKSESKSSLADFAGQYVYVLPDTTCVSLHLVSTGQATLATHRAGELRNETKGPATLEQGLLVLSLSKGRGARKQPRIYLPVRWDDRIYLIEEDRIPEFREAMSNYEEARHEPFGRFLLRCSDWNKRVHGRPSQSSELPGGSIAGQPASR
jgi:hypothetical protein